jgi:3'(2'), 5'-bisphosphate nucleotidase
MQDDMLLRVAIKAVAAAGEVARSVQRRIADVRRITKDDHSPVTVADFAIQAIIARELQAAFDHVLIVGEEHSDTLRQADHAATLQEVVDAVRLHEPHLDAEAILAAIDACGHDATARGYWTVDPIDGTKGFLRSQQYAVALAYIEHGRVKLGVIGGPNLPMNQSVPLEQMDDRGVLYYAAAGYGCWEVPGDDHLADPNRIQLLPRSPGDPVRVCESVEKAHSKQSDTQRLLESLRQPYEPVRLDSQCKYAVVARGQADAYLRFPTRTDYAEKIWDHAAGMLIAAEAGAIVTDIAGTPLDFSLGNELRRNRGILCTHPQLHAPLLSAIQRLGLHQPPPSAVAAAAARPT